MVVQPSSHLAVYGWWFSLLGWCQIKATTRAWAVMVVVLASLWTQQGAEAVCAVRLQLDELGSKVVLSSGNILVSTNATRSTTLSSPATFDAAVPRGLSGALYAVSQTLGACPAAADRAAWRASWPSFNLTSVSFSTTYTEAIAVYPALHLGKTMLAGFGAAPKYDYNVSDIHAAVTMGSIVAVNGQPGKFTAEVTTKLAEGWLSSYSTVTQFRVDNLQNLTANASAVTMSLDIQAINGSNTLVLEVPNLQLTYRAIGQLVLLSTAWNSFANHTLTSKLRASAVLDCRTYCGDYGRCQLVNGTARCVCDCGWSADTKGECNLPWGYCDAKGGGVLAEVVLESPPASSGGSLCPSNTSGVQPINGSCPSGYDWDKSGTACAECPSGFSGSGCVLCNTAAACQAKLSSSTADCLLSPLYQPRTAVKHYQCDVLDPNFAGIVGTTMDFSCSTTAPASGASVSGLSVGAGIVSSSSPVNATPYCTLAFRLAGMARDSAVVCTGWACEFATGSSKVYCPLVQCKCPKGCSSADGVISERTFTGLQTDVRMACGSEAGKGATTSDGISSCSVELGGLPLAPIPISCKTAECLDLVNGSATVQAATTDTKTATAAAPVIAWVPSMALVLVTVVTVAAVAYFERLVGPQLIGRAAATAPAAAAGATVAPAPAAATAQPVAEGTEGDEAVQASNQLSGGQLGSEVVPPSLPGPSPDQLQGQQPAQDKLRNRPPLPGQLATPSPQGTPQLGNSACERAPSGGGGGSCSSNGRGSGSADGSGGGVAGKGEVGALPKDDAAEGAYRAVDGQAAERGAAGAVAEGAMVQVLSWHGLSLSTRPQRSALPPWRLQTPVTLLSNVSGRAVRGELLAILGPSGSGKTTLLGVLAGLIQPGLHWKLSGTVRLDGRTVESPRHLAALVGHVPQHDLLCRSLTVAECVAASAALRLSWEELRRGRQHVQMRVASVLRELGISYLANRIVWPGGGSTLTAGGGGAAASTSLSGGERLRVAACLELVYDPPLLLLDEPLSGLDSATAKATMTVLRAVATGSGGCGTASSGRLVVASMHQPSPTLFASLDSVLLMSGGRVAAAGPPGSLVAVLTAAGLPPPPEVHIAEHLLDLVVSEPAQASQLCHWHERQVAASGADAPEAGPLPTSAVAEARGGGRDRGDHDYISALVAARGGGTGLWVRLRRLGMELGVVAWRSGLDLLRNPAMLALHLIVTAALGLLVGAVFSDTDLNVSGAQNRVGAIFFAVMLLACFATSAVDGIYPERATVDRDLLRRSYGIVPYMFAKLVLDGVLLRALPACAFGLPFYWLMGLRPQAAAFFTFLGAFVTMSCLSGAACIALSCVFSSPGRAVLLLNLLLLTCALFSGFLANKSSIVVWLRWITYLSPIRFCWEALVINELKPLVLTFSSPDLPQGLPAVKGSLFLSLLGVNANMLDTDLIVLGCMYAILALLAAVAGALRLAALRGRWT